MRVGGRISACRCLFCLLPFSVVGRIRFIGGPGGLMIGLSGFADLRLFFFPGKIFRFLTMVRTSRIPIRAAFAWGITVVSDGFCHCRPPFLRLPPGHGLTRRRGLCLLSAKVLRFLGYHPNGKNGRMRPAGGAYRTRTGPSSLEGCCATTTQMLRITAGQSGVRRAGLSPLSENCTTSAAVGGA